MKNRAFTLIEILVVIAIIGIIVTLAMPAFNSLGKAQSLTSAGNNLLDQIAQARQTAVARNRTVEMRFYKRRENPAQPADENINPARFRAYRTMIYDEARDSAGRFVTTPVELKPMQNFPKRMVISEEQIFSTLIFPYTDTNPPRPLLKQDINGTEKDVPYQVIRFKATGSTDLGVNGTPGPDPDKWFLTIKSDSEPKVGTDRPANNYFTIMLDPVSGRARFYRP